MKFTPHTLDVGYPIYGASFLSNTVLAVAGGGGEGSHGIPNKITAVLVDFANETPLSVQREANLAADEDSAMCLATGGSVMLLGVNQSAASIASGTNKHLRVFDELLQPKHAVQVSHLTDLSVYQKFVAVSHDGKYCAVAMSEGTTVTFLKHGSQGFAKVHLFKTDGDVKDLSFGLDGVSVAVLTAKSLTVVAASIGKTTYKHESFGKDAVSKVCFLDDETLLVGGSAPKNAGVVMYQLAMPLDTVLRRLVVSKKARGLTAMAVSVEGALIAFSGSDSSITLLNIITLRTIHVFKEAHTFAITALAFAPNARLLASVSADNTVRVVALPEALVSSLLTGPSQLQISVAVLAALIFGIFLQNFFLGLGYGPQAFTEDDVKWVRGQTTPVIADEL